VRLQLQRLPPQGQLRLWLHLADQSLLQGQARGQVLVVLDVLGWWASQRVQVRVLVRLLLQTLHQRQLLDWQQGWQLWGWERHLKDRQWMHQVSGPDLSPLLWHAGVGLPLRQFLHQQLVLPLLVRVPLPVHDWDGLRVQAVDCLTY
jgi:hypothetical protein